MKKEIRIGATSILTTKSLDIRVSHPPVAIKPEIKTAFLLVNYNEYASDYNLGIFTNKKDAEKVMARYEKENPEQIFDLEELELDNMELSNNGWS